MQTTASGEFRSQPSFFPTQNRSLSIFAARFKIEATYEGFVVELPLILETYRFASIAEQVKAALRVDPSFRGNIAYVGAFVERSQHRGQIALVPPNASVGDYIVPAIH